jgi:hypothetical protein
MVVPLWLSGRWLVVCLQVSCVVGLQINCRTPRWFRIDAQTAPGDSACEAMDDVNGLSSDEQQPPAPCEAAHAAAGSDSAVEHAVRGLCPQPARRTRQRSPYAQFDTEGNLIDQDMPGRW